MCDDAVRSERSSKGPVRLSLVKLQTLSDGLHAMRWKVLLGITACLAMLCANFAVTLLAIEQAKDARVGRDLMMVDASSGQVIDFHPKLVPFHFSSLSDSTFFTIEEFTSELGAGGVGKYRVEGREVLLCPPIPKDDPRWTDAHFYCHDKYLYVFLSQGKIFMGKELPDMVRFFLLPDRGLYETALEYTQVQGRAPPPHVAEEDGAAVAVDDETAADSHRKILSHTILETYQYLCRGLAQAYADDTNALARLEIVRVNAVCDEMVGVMGGCSSAPSYYCVLTDAVQSGCGSRQVSVEQRCLDLYFR
mmetsp:Transcript_10684/g.12492  ORF Transcript_10684/g.12492 Transcript_10684/m.12492 type:complete len:306 (+) Transcript_10684:341-1258(+)